MFDVMRADVQHDASISQVPGGSRKTIDFRICLPNAVDAFATLDALGWKSWQIKPAQYLGDP